jgi:hypothetical protein
MNKDVQSVVEAARKVVESVRHTTIHRDVRDYSGPLHESLCTVSPAALRELEEALSDLTPPPGDGSLSA